MSLINDILFCPTALAWTTIVCLEAIQTDKRKSHDTTVTFVRTVCFYTFNFIFQSSTAEYYRKNRLFNTGRRTGSKQKST